jgi:hypothetical protein
MGYTPPYLEVRKISGGYKVYPPTDVLGDAISIYPNGSTTDPYVYLDGGGNMKLGATPGALIVLNFGGDYVSLGFSGNTFEIAMLDANNDIRLTTSGTGRLKYGTYNAGAAADSTGYIEIKDSGGTTRKLMVQA